MKNLIVKSLVAASIACVPAFAIGESVNLSQFIRDNGFNPSEYVSGICDSSSTLKLFDGVVDYAIGNYQVRWYGTMTTAPATTCYAAIRAPSAFKPSHYRIYAARPGHNSNVGRRPLQWELRGVTMDFATNVIDEVAEDVRWASSWRDEQNHEYKEWQIPSEMQRCYREFIWVPKKSDWQGSGLGTDFKDKIVLVEIEIYGEPFVSVDCAPMDARYGDGVSINSSTPAVEGNCFPVGSQITLSPALNVGKGNRFIRWDVSPKELATDDQKTNSVLTLTAGTGNISATLWTQQPWFYDRQRKIITNDVWKLHVTELGGNRLDVGRRVNGFDTWVHSAYYVTATNGNTVAIQGDGLLDLSAPVTDGENAWKITKLRSACLGSHASDSRRGPQVVTSLIVPKTLTEMEENCLYFKGRDYCNPTLTNLVFDVPEFTGEFPATALLGQTKLATVLIKAPRMTSISTTAFGSSSVDNGRHGFVPFSKTDVTGWNLDSITELPPGIFYDGVNGTASGRVTGIMKMPMLTRCGFSCFRESHLLEVEFGCGYSLRDAKSLTLDFSVFNGAGLLRKVTFGPYHSMTNISTFGGGNVHAYTAFRNCPSLTNIVFLGPPPGRSFIDNLIQAQTKSIVENSKTVVIRGSGALGWKSLEGLSQPTEAEMAKAPTGLGERERILGVYETRDAPGDNGDALRKAWIVHSPSPHDPKGMVLLFR